jgi:hypothetical protein
VERTCIVEISNPSIDVERLGEEVVTRREAELEPERWSENMYAWVRSWWCPAGNDESQVVSGGEGACTGDRRGRGWQEEPIARLLLERKRR